MITMATMITMVDEAEMPFNFEFTHRNRRPPADPVNALLSFAYSLLAKDLTIICHSVGFDPFIGFYHQPRFGRPALALDLMEGFRPLIADSVVIGAINTGMVERGRFHSCRSRGRADGRREERGSCALTNKEWTRSSRILFSVTGLIIAACWKFRSGYWRAW